MVDRKRITWFVIIRLVVVSILFAATTFLYLQQSSLVSSTAYNGIVALSLLTVVLSLLLLGVVNKLSAIGKIFTYFQLIWDLHYVTVLIVLTGGIISPYSFLYLIVIIGVSISLNRREALLSAALCSIVYGALIDLQYYGKLEIVGLNQDQALQFGPLQVFYTIFVNILAFFLTAILSGYLAARAFHSERALQKKVVDYEELRALNSAIVASLDSGLITLTDKGNIRVFNRYAEDLTGLKQEDAYDLPLDQLMPCFKSLSVIRSGMGRDEVVWQSQDGRELTFGYKAVPFCDREGSHDGIIVNFKDLTEYKLLEAKLQRADRLAAIGELAARIAHEVRNPLASISGAVQLIAQGANIVPADQKLMEIVQRETVRLNGLISDFLDYARPREPVCTPVMVHPFVEEILLLAKQGEIFKHVTLQSSCPSDLVCVFDVRLIEQVLWNLLVNAGEAIHGNGTISIQVSTETLLGNGERQGVQFVVCDDGAGISQEVLARLFEPFYSTKDGGTGLGLATVYRIIESHQGTIDVKSDVNRGTRFSFWLPRRDAEGRDE